MFLSIVIPAYNEQNRIGDSLNKIYSYFKKTKDIEYEVIVVNDASTDNTEKIILNNILIIENKLRLLKNDKNRGKGFSIKKGIFASKGEYILFSDSDLSTPIEETEKLLSFIYSGDDIVIGSRSIKGSQVRVRQPFYREYMGKFFNSLVQAFVFKGIVDTQCGFKLLKSGAAKDIAKESRIDGFAFDVELLYLAKKKGYKIKEVPVVWINSPASKVNPIIDSYKMFRELLAIKKIHNETDISIH